MSKTERNVNESKMLTLEEVERILRQQKSTPTVSDAFSEAIDKLSRLEQERESEALEKAG